MPAVDLKQMTLSEKLSLMEALWDDLCRQEKDIPMPHWQKELLNEREREVKKGTAKFIPWERAKKRIAQRIS